MASDNALDVIIGLLVAAQGSVMTAPDEHSTAQFTKPDYGAS